MTTMTTLDTPAMAAARLVREVVVSCFRRPRPVTVSEWAQRHRKIVAEDAAEKGPWRNQRTAYLRGPMDCYNDHAVASISLMSAERVGKTEWLQNVLCYVADCAPTPTLVVYPTDVIAEQMNRKRIMPTFKGTPAVARHMTKHVRDFKAVDMQLDRMSIAYRGSNETSKLEALGYGLVIGDELDRCHPSTMSKTRGRGSSQRSSKQLWSGTPEDEWSGDPEDATQGIDRCFQQGDKRRLYVPCPRCGEYHTREFSRVRWIGPNGPGDLDMNPGDVAERAYFLCPNPECEHQILGSDNQAQLARCIWVPEGAGITRDGRVLMPDGRIFKGFDTAEERTAAREDEWKHLHDPDPVHDSRFEVQGLGGKYFSTGARDVSFQMHGLNTPFQRNPYGYLAKEYVENRGQMTREFVCRRLGQGWSRKGGRVKRSEFATLKGLPSAGMLARLKAGQALAPESVPTIVPAREWSFGRVPLVKNADGHGIAFLTATVDVQANCCWMEVVAWTRFAREAYLVDAIRIPREVKDKLANVAPALLKTWPMIDLATGKEVMRCQLTGAAIDAGKWSDEVYEFVRPRQVGKWNALAKAAAGAAGAHVAEGPPVIATKGYNFDGTSAGNSTKPWFLSVPEKDDPEIRRQGVVAPARRDGVQLYMVNSAWYKRRIRDTIKHEMETRAAISKLEEFDTEVAAGRQGSRYMSPEERRVYTGIALRPRQWFFPSDTPGWYIDQLTSEDEKPVLVRGEWKNKWTILPGHHATGNHLLDCRVLNCAVVEVLGLARK